MPHDKRVSPLVIYKGEKIEASKNPCRGRVVINEPGIFRLDWDNSHSWFNAKELKYCVYVLEPDFGIDTSQIVIFNQDIQSRKILHQKLRASFLFINTLKVNIGQSLRIVNKIEQVVERFLESPHLQTRENIFVICLDGFSERFYSRPKGKAKEHKGLDINSICLTNDEATAEGPLVLKNIADSYFVAEQSKKKIAYLAALLINVFNYSSANISQFLLFENQEEPVWGEDNQQLVREAFEAYTKKQGVGRKEKEEGPEVTFCDIKL